MQSQARWNKTLGKTTKNQHSSMSHVPHATFQQCPAPPVKGTPSGKKQSLFKMQSQASWKNDLGNIMKTQFSNCHEPRWTALVNLEISFGFTLQFYGHSNSQRWSAMSESRTVSVHFHFKWIRIPAVLADLQWVNPKTLRYIYTFVLSAFQPK